MAVVFVGGGGIFKRRFVVFVKVAVVYVVGGVAGMVE